MPAALPEAVRTRACELGRTLALDAVIAALAREGHKVGRATVGGWLKDARSAAQREAPAPGRKRPAKGAPAAPAPAVPPPARPATAPPEADAGGVDLAVLEELDRELGEMLRTARSDGDARLFATLVGRRVELRKSMQGFRPPPKVDANADPTSLEARAAVRRRVMKMIENAELAQRAPEAPA